MNRVFVLLIMFLGLASLQVSSINIPDNKLTFEVDTPVLELKDDVPLNGKDILRSIYQKFPEGKFSYEAFEYAMLGRQYILDHHSVSKPHILTIVDFSKPSTEDRFFVLDLESNYILYSSLTAHGKNSGENMATHFSNRSSSYQSSLGFYLTAETYFGSKGFSLKLDGIEPDINSKARERGIVVHAAPYVSRSFGQQHGRMGRSQGCPALPTELNRPIIQTIASGSIFFIYAPDQGYFQTSKICKSLDLQAFVNSYIPQAI